MTISDELGVDISSVKTKKKSRRKKEIKRKVIEKMKERMSKKWQTRQNVKQYRNMGEKEENTSMSAEEKLLKKS